MEGRAGEILDLLVKANRILANEGIVDDFGHVSARNSENPESYFLPCAKSPGRVTAEDVIEYRLDGEPIGDTAGRRSYSERAIHGAIYEARPDVMAVCHHHSSAILPFASSDAALRPVYHLGAVMGAEVPVWDAQEEFGDTSMLVDDLDKGRSLARRLGGATMALLRRHGAVIAAPGIREATFIAIYSAENAQVQARAMAMGTASYLTAGEIEASGRVNLSPVGIERSWPTRLARAGLAPD